MTVLFKVQSSDQKEVGVFKEKCLLCKVSSKNIIAFSRINDFGLVLNNSVYVCDIVTPWDTFKVCSLENNINVLEWNENGELLLLGLKGGNVEIWTPVQQAINSWRMLCKASFACEDVIGARFFHNGKSLYFNSQKRELSAYAACERLEHNPTVCKLGSSPVEGFFAVTSSGLFGASIIPNHNQIVDTLSPTTNTLTISTHSIGLSRNFIHLCDMCHSSRGTINIAISYTSQSHIIYCFKAFINVDNDDNLQMKCESLPSVFLNTKKNTKMKKLKWCVIANEDVIIVVHSNMGMHSLEQWNLTKKQYGVHALLHKSKTENAPLETWENKAKHSYSTEINEICISSIPSDYVPIYIIHSDCTIQLFESGLNTQKQTIFEERNSCLQFTSGCLSAMSQILLVFDKNGQMYALQIPYPHQERHFKSTNLSLSVALLEYSILSGVDASDILLLNISNLDLILEKLTENFSRQPVYAKQYYYSSFLSLKSNICRIHKQQDFDNLILLHSISITFKSLLRPSDLNNQDKGPADNLSVILSDYIPDIDKVLCNLDAKDFTVEPITLQSLQQLIQWVSDIALNMLNKLPDDITKGKFNKRQGYDISRDMVAISSIRELLVIIRVWGLLNSHCLPIYTKSVENVDVLSILFRLLTRLAQNTAEPDDILLDECNMLSSQVLIPIKQTNTPTTLLNSQMLLVKSYPLQFMTSIEPCVLQDVQLQQVIFACSKKDDVSNLQLGTKSTHTRQCVRCGFRNGLSRMAKSSALKAWCNRWLNCHCGGYWKTVI